MGENKQIPNTPHFLNVSYFSQYFFQVDKLFYMPFPSKAR